MAGCKSKHANNDAGEDLYENFVQKSWGELKDYLSLRGLSISGRKRELVARAFSACERNVPIIVSDDEFKVRLETEYQSRMKGLSCDPRSLLADSWVNDVGSWPELDLGKVFSFILSHKEHDSEYVGKYKLCKAYSYFASGFVGTVYSYNDTYNICVLSTKVTPSQKVRDVPRDVWAAIDRAKNEVMSAWCSCTAGFSQSCNHVMALLYKVEHAVAQGYTNPACTSIPCRWNDCSFREVEPKKIKELNIREDNRLNVEEGHKRRNISLDMKISFDPRREWKKKEKRLS